MFILNNENDYNTVFDYYFTMHNPESNNKKNNLDYMGVTYLISDLKNIKKTNGHLEILKNGQWILNAKIIDIGFDIENDNFYSVTLKLKKNNVVSNYHFIIDTFEIHPDLSLKNYYINLNTQNQITIKIIDK